MKKGEKQPCSNREAAKELLLEGQHYDNNELIGRGIRKCKSRHKRNHVTNNAVSLHRVESHTTSVYFTPASMYKYELPNRNRNSDCHKSRKKKVSVHIRSRKARNERTQSTSSDECAAKIISNLCEPPQKKIPTKCEEKFSNLHKQFRPMKVNEFSEENGVNISIIPKPRKCIPGPIPPITSRKPRTRMTDTFLQTETTIKSHKECQTFKANGKAIDISLQTQGLKRYHKECQTKLEQAAKHLSATGLNIYCTNCTLQISKKDDGKMVETVFDKRERIMSRPPKIHPFPFVGKSPSGNLKISPHMISFENKNLGILVADPNITKITHKEWRENEEYYYQNPKADEYTEGMNANNTSWLPVEESEQQHFQPYHNPMTYDNDINRENDFVVPTEPSYEKFRNSPQAEVNGRDFSEERELSYAQNIDAGFASNKESLKTEPFSHEEFQTPIESSEDPYHQVQNPYNEESEVQDESGQEQITLNPLQEEVEVKEEKARPEENVGAVADSELVLSDIPSYSTYPSKAVVQNPETGEYVIAEPTQNEIQAAITIQRHVRGFLARNKIKKMKQAAKIIQNALRLYLNRRANKTDKKDTTTATPNEEDDEPLNHSKSLRWSKTDQPFLRKGLDAQREALLVFGGSDPTKGIDGLNTGAEIFMYTINSMSWTHVGTLPEPRTHFGIVQLGNEVWIIGGTDPRHKNMKDRNIAVTSVWKANLGTGEWQIGPNDPKSLRKPRSHFGCVSKDGFIYVFGGNDEDAKSLATCLKYDLTNHWWTSIASMGGPRVSMGTAVYEDHIWIAGGVSKDPKKPILRSVVCYDTVSDGWTNMSALPLPRAFAPLVVAHGKLYIIGGAGPKNKKTKQQVSVPYVMAFDKRVDVWREFGLLNIARHGHAAVAIDHKLVVLGGISSDFKGPINSVEIFDLSTSRSTKGRNLYQKLSGIGVIPLI